MTPIAFFAAGHPQTKGSAKAFPIRRANGSIGAVVTNDNPKAKAWASVIAGAASEAMGARQPLRGPLTLDLVFYLPRPKSHYTKRGLRPEAPVYVESKPDYDKLCRCATDALTGIAFVDDSQVARAYVEKRYSNDGRIGVRVQVACLPGRHAMPLTPREVEQLARALMSAEGINERDARRTT